MLKLVNINIKRGANIILQNINLELVGNQVTALYSPNGSGKTSLAQTILGNPEMVVESGEILFLNQKINQLDSTERSKSGIFVSFQNPPEIPGVTTLNLLKESYISIYQNKPKAKEFLTDIKNFNNLLGLKEDFYKQSFNVGASGGEKKKNELLQILMLKPKIIVLDEVDSGLDSQSKDILIDLLRKIKSPSNSFLIITHDKQFLTKIQADKIYTIENQTLKAM